MQANELSALSQQVLWAVFIVSALFGVIAQKTHFCTMGAISDVVNMGDWNRLRQWAMAVGVGMIGFASMVWLGWIDPGKSIYAGTRWIWLSALVGGAFFGFGMVLASGCGSKTLVRIGGGNLKALVVFFVMGFAAFATLKGITAVLRVGTVDRVAVEIKSGTQLPGMVASVLGLDARIAGLVLAGLIGGALIVWALAGRDFRKADNLLAGFGIGAVVVAMWWVSGRLGYVAEHPETLQEAFLGTTTGRMEALTFTAPMAYTLDWFVFFSDKSKVLTLAVVSVFGVVAGSALWALLSRSFRWEGFASTEDLANHLVGATLMGIGGVTAMGCTVGQGLSGMSTLSITSMVAVLGIAAGAAAAFRYQMWRLERTL
jgi:uncharacterized membrane protein YedE/YeeE